MEMNVICRNIDCASIAMMQIFCGFCLCLFPYGLVTVAHNWIFNVSAN